MPPATLSQAEKDLLIDALNFFSSLNVKYRDDLQATVKRRLLSILEKATLIAIDKTLTDVENLLTKLNK